MSIQAFSIGETENTVDISDELAGELNLAQKKLVGLSTLEREFEVFVLAVKEFENSLARNAISAMIFDGDQDQFFFDLRCELELKILALLAAARAFHDHRTRLIKKYLNSNDLETRIRQVFSSLYDDHFSYRLVEMLRNMVQHSSTAMSLISVHHTGDQDQPIHKQHSMRIGLTLTKAHIEQNKEKFKEKLYKEILESGYEKIDLRYCFRHYAKLLFEGYLMVRALTENELDDCESVFQGIVEKLEKTAKTQMEIRLLMFNDKSGTFDLKVFRLNSLVRLRKLRKRNFFGGEFEYRYYSGELIRDTNTFPNLPNG